MDKDDENSQKVFFENGSKSFTRSKLMQNQEW